MIIVFFGWEVLDGFVDSCCAFHIIWWGSRTWATVCHSDSSCCWRERHLFIHIHWSGIWIWSGTEKIGYIIKNTQKSSANGVQLEWHCVVATKVISRSVGCHTILKWATAHLCQAILRSAHACWLGEHLPYQPRQLYILDRSNYIRSHKIAWLKNNHHSIHHTILLII